MKSISRREKFVNLANKRVNNSIKNIRLIGNLSNRSNYTYNDKDVTKIYNALKREVNAMKERFHEERGGTEPEFSIEK